MTSSETIQYARLAEVDEEVAYLAALTVEGLKPMSRWEKGLDAEAIEPMTSLGLVARQVPRTVTAGPDLRETIFSLTSSLLDVYESLFSGKPIDKSATTQQWEGFLFGFPPCCISYYIDQPYASHDISPTDQEILFHWACPHCAITPSLVPAYRRILALIQNSF